MDFQEGEIRPKQKAPKVYKERGPRGKYKPREGKTWTGQFLNRRPPAVAERSRARSARDESVEVETPGDQDRSQRSASETPSLSSPKGKEPEWYPDPPMMEFPYLQHPFPFHEYEAPPNRVDTGDFGGTPQPLPDDWYRPQGSVAGEDLFTQEKLHYSLSMAKKIEVDTDHLRMDVYYQRNRLEEIRHEAQHAGGGGEGNHHSEPIKDPPRVYNRPHQTGGQQRSDRRTDVSGQDKDKDGTSTPAASNPSTINEARQNTSASLSTTLAADGAEAEDQTSEMEDRKRRLDTSTSPTLTDYYQVNAFMTSLFTPGEAQPTSETPLSPAACRILQTLLLNLETKMIGMGCHFQRQELTRRLALIDTLQTGAGTLGDSPAPWRRNQRQSPAPAENADTDAAKALVSGARTGDEDHHYISPYRRLQKRPFISNPLEVPAAMEPFWKARDYMERQALEARIRAAAEEVQRRQPRALSSTY
ncbi:hypothetical protein BGZ70_004716 [Mortierella alpina]|uniref:Uncharacterized protein n=1 Tax=Mortierella alpina TaxID=64518 RepID=A0A9P6ISA2_MORAP|nr:hypothetical protein BGZ70_004716 [Mortierella alpina]